MVPEGETKSSKESKKLSVKEQSKYAEVLYKAVKEENLTKIQHLLAKNKTNVNGMGTERWSPLWLACESGFSTVVELLSRADGIDVNQAKTDDGCTPLSVACQNGHVPVVELLLASSDIDVNQHDTQNVTPLNIASDNGHVEVVRLLLQQPNIDLNKKDDWNDSPLDAARKKRTPGVAFDDHTEILFNSLSTNAGAQ